MNEQLITLIKRDIGRCENHTEKEGSYELFQALVGKYNGYFPRFSDDIPVMGKACAVGSQMNYLSELIAVKEKLELLLITEQNKDPLFAFKDMCANDLVLLKEATQGTSLSEEQKQQLYLAVTAKYHPYVPQLGEGLYQYYKGFYEEVTGSSLKFNLAQIYNKLLTFQSLNYPGLTAKVKQAPSTVVNINNKNENHNTMTVSFDTARETVNNMTSLPDEDIQEVLKKIDELESIVKSPDGKSKKWSKAKSIIKWIADKGVDVGIAILPLLLQIK